MKRAVWILSALLALAGCGDEDAAISGRAGSAAPVDGPASAAESKLVLTPRVELIGLGDVFDALRVTRLAFTAEVFLLPEEVGAGVGDAVDIRFDFEDGVADTATLQRDLHLDAPGRYRILLRLYAPDAETASVEVQGTVLDAEAIARNKADEPAPSPAEPAPSPADEADEPAPSPAEPAPSPARQKPDDDPAGLRPGELLPEGQPVDVALRRSFEFYAGTVEVTDGDRELVVTWDIRAWLRVMLAEPLGLPAPTYEAFEPARPGFTEGPTDFRADAR
ncbi:MAG: hypothetical protein H6704_17425 [Myxococcales bacterium]|nr:hypothetical protein [Myxococcales bacterium]